MKKIRNAVFETNSSSTHSISVSEVNSDELMDNIMFMNEDDNVVVNPGQFGWEQEVYNDSATKASYMLTYIKNYCGEREAEFEEMFKEVIKGQTGCNDVIFNESGDQYYAFGYIDHQSSSGNAYHWVFEDKETLRQFIFNKESILETDNDNH
jgi:hypothetical protein